MSTLNKRAGPDVKQPQSSRDELYVSLIIRPNGPTSNPRPVAPAHSWFQIFPWLFSIPMIISEFILQVHDGLPGRLRLICRVFMSLLWVAVLDRVACYMGVDAGETLWCLNRST